MTGNQIAYWNLQESKRANQAKEQETLRSNLAKEQLGSETLSETKRSNIAKETETNRSNLINEQIKTADVDSQIDRRNVQNMTDAVKSVESITKAASMLSSLFI